MPVWNTSPLWKLALVYAIGIALGARLSYWYLLPILVLLSSAVLLAERHGKSTYLCGFILLLGFLRITLMEDELHPSLTMETPAYFLLQLEDAPFERRDNYLVEARVLQMNEEQVTEYKVQVIGNEDWKNRLPGEIIACRARLSEINGAQHPSAFDYRGFMRSKGIFACLKPEGTIRSMGKSAELRYILLRSRQYGLRALPMDTEAGRLIAALVLGWKAELDSDTKLAFRNSGVMHVLAVSGLHVGLVMVLIQLITGWMRNKPSLRLIRYLVILLSVWAYALLAGASDSVLRAATMCSFLGMADLLGRKSSGLNLLGAAAFVLLSIDPKSLFEPGLQLSFCAVAGLILYQPRKQIRKKHYAVSYLFNASRTSVVAQIWTSALAVYYFGTLPLYFLLGNLLLLPIATLLLYFGIATISFSAIPQFAELLQKVSIALAESMLYTSEKIAALPYSQLEFSGLSTHWLIISLIFLSFLGVNLQSRKILYLNWMLLLPISGTTIDLVQSIFQEAAPRILAYGEKSDLILKVKEETLLHIAYKSHLDSTEAQGFLRLSNEECSMEFVDLESCSIGVIYKWNEPQFREKCVLDVLILAGPYPKEKDLNDWIKYFSPKLIVLHPRYSLKHLDQLKALKPKNCYIQSMRKGWIAFETVNAHNELSLSHEDH